MRPVAWAANRRDPFEMIIEITLREGHADMTRKQKYLMTSQLPGSERGSRSKKCAPMRRAIEGEPRPILFPWNSGMLPNGSAHESSDPNEEGGEWLGTRPMFPTA